MAYDRMDWHYEADDFPKDLPEESAGTHTGMFLAWMIINNLESQVHREDSAEALAAVRERRITGRDFLIEECDGQLWEEDLSNEGNRFAELYYEGNGRYFIDYDETLGKKFASLYYVADTWENYDVIAPIISRRYENWTDKNNPSE